MTCIAIYLGLYSSLSKNLLEARNLTYQSLLEKGYDPTNFVVPTMEQFYVKYKNLVLKQLRQLGAKPWELEDLYQDVIARMIRGKTLEVFGKPKEGKRCASFKHHIFMVSRTAYSSYIRKNQKRVKIQDPVTGKLKWSDKKTILDVSLHAEINGLDGQTYFDILDMEEFKTSDLDLEILLKEFSSELESITWTHFVRGRSVVNNLGQVYQMLLQGYTTSQVAESLSEEDKKIRGQIKRVYSLLAEFLHRKQVSLDLLFT